MKLTQAEWKIMDRVWRKHPATAREVLESQGDPEAWAYTTVKTMMSRLVEKGALSVRLEGNTSVYEPRITRLQARVAAVRSLLETAFGGSPGPLLHMLVEEQDLSPEERDELRRKLAEMEQQGEDE